MHKTSISAGALLAGLAVVLGAFGAHALKAILEPSLLQSFETGVRYQFYHSLALVLVGILSLIAPSKWWRSAMTCFIIGTVLFSGSIYLLVGLKSAGQVGLGSFGLLTPIGGLFFILGWLFMLLGSLQIKITPTPNKA